MNHPADDFAKSDNTCPSKTRTARIVAAAPSVIGHHATHWRLRPPISLYRQCHVAGLSFAR
jgi:hypothetical protein